LNLDGPLVVDLPEFVGARPLEALQLVVGWRRGSDAPPTLEEVGDGADRRQVVASAGLEMGVDLARAPVELPAHLEDELLERVGGPGGRPAGPPRSIDQGLIGVAS
jgi:hypothetical protein